MPPNIQRAGLAVLVLGSAVQLWLQWGILPAVLTVVAATALIVFALSRWLSTIWFFLVAGLITFVALVVGSWLVSGSAGNGPSMLICAVPSPTVGVASPSITPEATAVATPTPSPTPEPQPLTMLPAKDDCPSVYALQQDDIVVDLADEFGVTDTQIIGDNAIRDVRSLQIGEKLLIRCRGVGGQPIGREEPDDRPKLAVLATALDGCLEAQIRGDASAAASCLTGLARSDSLGQLREFVAGVGEEVAKQAPGVITCFASRTAAAFAYVDGSSGAIVVSAEWNLTSVMSDGTSDEILLRLICKLEVGKRDNRWYLSDPVYHFVDRIEPGPWDTGCH
jgi:hypothetical protein